MTSEPTTTSATTTTDGDELDRVADRLVEQARTDGVALTGPGGLLGGLTKKVLETALAAELTDHLGYEHGDPRPGGNARNGTTPKTVRTDIGQVRIDVPRDRAGSFEPAVLPKHVRRLGGFNEAVISLYAKGLTTGDIANHLADVYGDSASKELVSRVTDQVTEAMTEWQSRPLDPVYPVILIDAIMLKVRDGQVANRPVYVAMGISLDGERDVLGMWLGPSGGEGAKHWLSMLTELKNRGVQDVCIVSCDGLKGLPEAINATWPQAVVQTCVVHLVRNSLRYASKKHWAAITRDLKPVYTAPTPRPPKRGSLSSPSSGGRPTRPWSPCGNAPGPSCTVPGLPRRDPPADLYDG